MKDNVEIIKNQYRILKSILLLNFYQLIFSDLKDGAISVSLDGTSSATSIATPILVVGLIISIIFNVVVGGYVFTQIGATERMKSR